MTGLDLDRLAPVATPGIRVLPIVHERLEMAVLARAALDRLDPAAVAVELPTTLAEVARKAVARLPRVSVVLSQEPGEDALVWIVAPGDPLVEALRWAIERGRPWYCIDPDVPYTERHRDPVPDPYSIWSLEPEAYLELLGPGDGVAGGESDGVREAGMAFHARRARRELEGGELLVLTGAAHAAALARRLGAPAAQPLLRVRRASVDLRHLAPDGLTGLLPDAPLAHAVWERVRRRELPPPVELDRALSRKVSLIQHGLRLIHGEGGESEERRRRDLLDLAAREGTREALGWGRAPDRRALGGVVWRVAAGSYREQTENALSPWQRRLFFNYSQRCARLRGALAPGLLEWVVAARGVADDNLAWEVFDAARCYPWQEDLAEIATVRLDGSELDLGTHKVRFRRRFLRVKRRPISVPVRGRPQADDPAEWLRGFDSAGICSYPREDVVVEDYGRFVQKRAVSMLSAEKRRTEPFTSGMLDGLDLRETLRNPHDHRIYVQEEGKVPGEAGSVVVIFDPDREDRRFPFRMTWLGEHDQESDMAFYATDPAEQVVGPGIMRATYGGFMLTMPRGRLFDVWADPEYRIAGGKAEALVMAAIDYSEEKIVAHVARYAPREALKRYAAAQAKRLLHIPLGSLSPVTLKRIRVFHLLAGRDKRAIASDYIW
jgi:hypothetical protein